VKYNGITHDSGDPVEFGRKIVRSIEAFGISTRNVALIFPEPMNKRIEAQIVEELGDRVKLQFSHRNTRG
jgi:nicotinic acid phosphoribosyltransferase